MYKRAEECFPLQWIRIFETEVALLQLIAVPSLLVRVLCNFCRDVPITYPPLLVKRLCSDFYSSVIHHNGKEFLYFLSVSISKDYHPTTVGKDFLLWFNPPQRKSLSISSCFDCYLITIGNNILFWLFDLSPPLRQYAPTEMPLPILREVSSQTSPTLWQNTFAIRSVVK